MYKCTCLKQLIRYEAEIVSYKKHSDMKFIKNGAIVVCALISISADAQKTNQNKTRLTPPKPIKTYDTLLTSEQKKNEYKSKDWHQGIEVISERSKSGGKTISGMEKKPGKPRKAPPTYQTPPKTEPKK